MSERKILRPDEVQLIIPVEKAAGRELLTRDMLDRYVGGFVPTQVLFDQRQVTVKAQDAEGDELISPDIRIYTQGLINREPGVAPPRYPKDHPYWKTKDGYRERRREERFIARQKAAYARGDRMLVSLSEPGSIKWVEVDRPALHRLMAQGWTFDAETTKWAGPPPAVPAPRKRKKKR